MSIYVLLVTILVLHTSESSKLMVRVCVIANHRLRAVTDCVGEDARRSEENNGGGVSMTTPPQQLRVLVILLTIRKRGESKSIQTDRINKRTEHPLRLPNCMDESSYGVVYGKVRYSKEVGSIAPKSMYVGRTVDGMKRVETDPPIHF